MAEAVRRRAPLRSLLWSLGFILSTGGFLGCSTADIESDPEDIDQAAEELEGGDESVVDSGQFAAAEILPSGGAESAGEEEGRLAPEKQDAERDAFRSPGEDRGRDGHGQDPGPYPWFVDADGDGKLDPNPYSNAI